MRYIGIIILLVLCLTLLFFTGCMINTVKPEPASGNLENQEDINQSSNNSQNSLTGSIYEPGTEEPGTVYPQDYATGTGTVGDPWTNSCIESAYTACPTGGTIYLRAGYYQLNGQLTVEKQLNIIGEGMGKTIIKTADAHGIYTRINGVAIKNLTIDGDAQTDGEDRDCIGVSGYYGDCDYTILEDIEVKNAGSEGIDNFQTSHTTFKNVYTHDNWGYGIHAGGAIVGKNKYNVYQDLYAWNNGDYGFVDRGNYEFPNEYCYNIFDNINCWDNNGEGGIEILYQKGGVLSNSTSSGNAGKGIKLYVLDDFNVHDCLVTLNEEEGLYLGANNNVNFTNVIVKNNNTLGIKYCSGILISSCIGTKFTSCQSYDDRDNPLQEWGLYVYGTTDYVGLVNCKLTPNKTSNIYISGGAVITYAYPYNS